MIDRTKRPVTPELRSIPLTYLDCKYAKERQDPEENDCAFDRLQMMDTRHCTDIVKDGNCPGGFAA